MTKQREERKKKREKTTCLRSPRQHSIVEWQSESTQLFLLFFILFQVYVHSKMSACTKLKSLYHPSTECHLYKQTSSCFFVSCFFLLWASLGVCWVSKPGNADALKKKNKQERNNWAHLSSLSFFLSFFSILRKKKIQTDLSLSPFYFSFFSLHCRQSDGSIDLEWESGQQRNSRKSEDSTRGKERARSG